MNQHDVKEDELKPAFLMLSGCETDLWKLTRPLDGSPNEVSDEHFKQSQRWLQKVYGLQAPVAGKLSAHSFRINLDDRIAFLAHSPTDSGNPPSGSRLTTAAHDLDCSLTDASTLHTLEREVQSLRDNQARQATLLDCTNSAKRKLEDDLSREVALRRRLERQLDEADKAIHSARKMENYAIDQLKREVDIRRRAEDRANAEREKRKDAERSMESMTIKPLFEGIAGMFQRAAQEGMPLARTDQNLPPVPSRP